MVTDLDARLDSAGASLRAAVGGIEPHSLPTPSPARRPLLAAAAVLVVVAAVAVAAATLRHDDDSDVSTDPTEVPRLVLDESIVGLPATGAAELPLTDAGAGSSMTVAVYDAPLDGGTSAPIGVITFRLQGDGYSWEPSEDSEAITVRGQQGWYVDDASYGPSVAWEAESGLVTTVASRDLGGRAGLVAAVEAGDDTGDGFAPGPVGPGLAPPELRGRPAAVEMSTATALPRGAVGHVVGYQSEDDPDRGAFLSVFAGRDDDIAAVRWLNAADTPVEVRGREGWLSSRTFTTGSSSSSGSGSSDGTTSDTDESAPTESSVHSLIWEESPGIWVVLGMYGATTDEVLRVAEQGVVAAPAAEWEALITAASSATPIGEEAAVSSESADGTSWSVYLDDDGTVCAAVQTDSSGTEQCGSAPGGAEILEDDDGTPLVVYGAFPEGAVDVRTGDGSPLGASTALSEDGVTVYAVTLDEGPPPPEVVFVDADDLEVSRVQVGFAPATEVEVEGEAPTSVP